MLGSAYEYLIKMFADSAGKKGGEFYTPNEVVKLLVALIKPQKGMKIYDPTVGSGGMLIQSRNYLLQQGRLKYSRHQAKYQHYHHDRAPPPDRWRYQIVAYQD